MIRFHSRLIGNNSSSPFELLSQCALILGNCARKISDDKAAGIRLTDWLPLLGYAIGLLA
jgi:hypothetical protein